MVVEVEGKNQGTRHSVGVFNMQFDKILTTVIGRS